MLRYTIVAHFSLEKEERRKVNTRCVVRADFPFRALSGVAVRLVPY